MKSFNPLVWAGALINGALDKQQQGEQPFIPAGEPSAAPATPAGRGIPADEGQTLDSAPVGASQTPTLSEEASRALEGVAVAGRFLDAQSQEARIDTIINRAAARTDEFRREAESFDDEKAAAGEKALRLVFSLFAYAAPSWLALVIGLAVGDTFTPKDATLAYSLYTHTLSVLLEMSLPVLGFVVALCYRRAGKDRSQVAACAVYALIFLILGLGNAVVQVFMVSKSFTFDASTGPAILFRSVSPLVIDSVATIYLSVTGVKSLKRYLADRRAVIDAVRDVSGINILLDAQQSQAALNQMQSFMDMDAKKKRAATWNRIEEIQAMKMIKSAERAMNDDDDDGAAGSGAYRRRRY